MRKDGADGASELWLIALEVTDELHLLKPQPSVRIGRKKTPDRFLEAATQAIRKG